MAVTLNKISEINGVSGNEADIRKYIISEIDGKCDGITIDTLGNIIAYKRGISQAKRVLVGTNMDEAGFIVTDITDTGYIKFGAVGSVDPRTIVSKRVVIGRDEIKGIIGMKAIHVTTADERKKAVKLSELYIDIGAKNKKKALKRVKKGDYISFDTLFGTMGECIKGKALDRMGCVCLIEAMEQTPAYDTYFVFSVQREIPCAITGRGMRTAAYEIKPDIAVVIDTVDSGDGYKQENPAARLGSGAVIEYMDRTSIGYAKLTARVEEKAKKLGIKIQRKTSSAAATIAGAAAQAGAGTVTVCIGIPCRYSHSPVSIMNKNDINAVTVLCTAVIKESDVITDEAVKKAD